MCIISADSSHRLIYRGSAPAREGHSMISLISGGYPAFHHYPAGLARFGWPGYTTSQRHEKCLLQGCFQGQELDSSMSDVSIS